MEKIKFSIKLTVGDLYYFIMYHYYTSFAGIFGTILSLLAAGVLVRNFNTMIPTEKLFFFIIAVAFTILNPIMMYVKAVNQIHTNKSLGGELTYFLDDQMIAIRMGGEKADILWPYVSRVKDNGRELVVYVSASRGYIWPKKQIAAYEDAIITCIQAHVDPRRIKIKKK